MQCFVYKPCVEKSAAGSLSKNKRAMALLTSVDNAMKKSDMEKGGANIPVPTMYSIAPSLRRSLNYSNHLFNLQ